MAEGEDIYAKLGELNKFYDKIFEYLPANESKDTDLDAKDSQQSQTDHQNSNQPNPKSKQHKDQNEPQKPMKPPIMKKQFKDKGSKKRPGFEGQRVIRTKRGAD